jgi:hypothetical protein
VVVLIGFSPDAALKSAAGAKGDETLPGVLRLDLGTLRDSLRYNAAMLLHAIATSTISIPPGDKLNMTAIVVESEDESLILNALTDAFNSNKSDLSAALKKALSGN